MAGNINDQLGKLLVNVYQIEYEQKLCQNYFKYVHFFIRPERTLVANLEGPGVTISDIPYTTKMAQSGKAPVLTKYW